MTNFSPFNLKVLLQKIESDTFALPILADRLYQHGVYPDIDSLTSFLPVLRGMILSAGMDMTKVTTLIASDVFYKLLEGNEELSDKILKWYISSVDNLFSDNTFDAISLLSSIYNDHRVVGPFLSKVVNSDTIVNIISQSKLKLNIYKVYLVLDGVKNLFSNDSITTILKRNKHFLTTLIFGNHPLLLNYPDLQIRWIRAFIKSSIAAYFKNFYITDETIETISPELAFKLASKMGSYIQNPAGAKTYFDVHKLITRASIYALATGDSGKIRNISVVSNIKTKRHKV